MIPITLISLCLQYLAPPNDLELSGRGFPSRYLFSLP